MNTQIKMILLTFTAMVMMQIVTSNANAKSSIVNITYNKLTAIEPMESASVPLTISDQSNSSVHVECAVSFTNPDSLYNIGSSYFIGYSENFKYDFYNSQPSGYTRNMPSVFKFIGNVVQINGTTNDATVLITNNSLVTDIQIECINGTFGKLNNNKNNMS